MTGILTALDLSAMFRMNNKLAPDQSINIFSDKSLLAPKTLIMELYKRDKNVKFQAALLSSFG